MEWALVAVVAVVIAYVRGYSKGREAAQRDIRRAHGHKD